MTDRPCAPLTQERIVAAQSRLPTSAGSPSSACASSPALGYEVMSLYNDVASKDAMVDAILNAVAAEMPRSTPGGDWKGRAASVVR